MNNYQRFAKLKSFTAEKPKAQENEILIYGPISDFAWWGDEVTAKSIMDKLDELDDAKEISVRINSPGGLVFEGITIYNALLRHKAKINIHIDGLAASAASLIAMAGDKISMAENSTIMIHEPWTIVLGAADDLIHEAEVLEKITKGMIKNYSARTGLTESKITEMLKAETWFTAEEAKENGFADEIIKSKEKPNAKLDLSVYSNVPDWVADKYQLEDPPVVNAKELEMLDTPHRRNNLKRRLEIISLS